MQPWPCEAIARYDRVAVTRPSRKVMAYSVLLKMQRGWTSSIALLLTVSQVNRAYSDPVPSYPPVFFGTANDARYTKTRKYWAMMKT